MSLESLLPFGPFHLVVLHLPIGLIVGIWVLECFVPIPYPTYSTFITMFY